MQAFLRICRHVAVPSISRRAPTSWLAFPETINNSSYTTNKNGVASSKINNLNRREIPTLFREIRLFSSSSLESTSSDLSDAATQTISAMGEEDIKKLQAPFWTKPHKVSTDDGREFLVFRTGYHPKLKPHIVRKRIEKLKTYEGKERNIRGSKWKLNLVCQFAAGMTVDEAIKQLKFSKKGKAPIVSKVIQRTSNLADIRHGIQRSQLEVAECFATRGTPEKRIKIHARGKFGRMEMSKSHMRVVLREIDFPLKIYQAKTARAKEHWYNLQQKAEVEYREAASRREEVELLEQEEKKKLEENKSNNS